MANPAHARLVCAWIAVESVVRVEPWSVSLAWQAVRVLRELSTSLSRRRRRRCVWRVCVPVTVNNVCVFLCVCASMCACVWKCLYFVQYIVISEYFFEGSTFGSLVLARNS